jgi:uncharacterized membrane protein YphA (DoxX/SURF4 family)
VNGAGENGRKSSALEAAGVAARWLVGGAFVYMGLNKALHPVDFLKLVHQYDIVTTPFLLNSIGAALPWFEIFCGVLLVLGVAVRGTALVMITMLVPFTVLVLRRALAISAAQHILFTQVKFDCGCGTGEVFIWKKMVENATLMLLSVWLVSGAGRKFCARFSLFCSGDAKAPSLLPRPKPEQGRSAARV